MKSLLIKYTVENFLQLWWKVVMGMEENFIFAVLCVVCKGPSAFRTQQYMSHKQQDEHTAQ